MKKREFNKLIKKISPKKILDINLIPTLTDDERSAIVYFMVRERVPIVEELIPEGFDISWLHCCAYLYKTKGKKYNWIHTSEHQIR